MQEAQSCPAFLRGLKYARIPTKLTNNRSCSKRRKAVFDFHVILRSTNGSRGNWL